MADVNSIEMKKDEIILSLKISKEEYEFLKQATADLMVVPISHKFMNNLLTTGKLGNSNRLMLPKKILDKLDVKKMDRKVPGRIFRMQGNVYLLTRLHGKRNGVPVFGGEE
ncbi:MAG: hypothetical protein MUP55_00195 [Candidatus Aenigmarchaeota archaeon]|nr:hypothetical protein [Candidatus Aenigmarchaeota archaeon]